MPPGQALVAIKQRLYHILETGKTPDLASRLTDWFIGALIVANVAAVSLETVPRFDTAYGSYFHWFELFSVAVFSIEYFLRLWVCTEHPPFQHIGPFRCRLRFSLTPFALIDLIAILPFYLQLFIGIDLRAMRLFRMLRFLKLARYSPALTSLGRVLSNERRSLAAALLIMFGLLVVSASMIYTVEHEAQPAAFASIPHAMWWAIATLTTVGYGDITPITPIGKMVGGLVMLLGLGMFALPIGIIATGFANEIRTRDFAVTWGMVARVPLFRGMEGQEVARIVGLLKARAVREGEVIVWRGDIADAMYFISSGEVEVDRDGVKRILKAGDFFGEAALLQEERRRVTVKALTHADILVLAADDLRLLIQTDPKLRAEIAAVAREREQDFSQAGPP